MRFALLKIDTPLPMCVNAYVSSVTLIGSSHSYIFIFTIHPLASPTHLQFSINERTKKQHINHAEGLTRRERVTRFIKTGTRSIAEVIDKWCVRGEGREERGESRSACLTSLDASEI